MSQITTVWGITFLHFFLAKCPAYIFLLHQSYTLLMHYTSVTITRVNTTGSLKHRTHPQCACGRRQGQAGCVPTSRAPGAAVLHPTEGHSTRELSLLLRTRAKELSKDSKFHLVPVPMFVCGKQEASPCSWHSSSGSAQCRTTRVAPWISVLGTLQAPASAPTLTPQKYFCAWSLPLFLLLPACCLNFFYYS